MPPRRVASQRARRQQQDDSEVDDPDSSPARPKASQKGKGRADAPVVTKPAAANALEQPLVKESATRMRSTQGECEMMRKNLLAAFDALVEAAEEVAEAFDEEDEEGKALLDELDTQARQMLDKLYEQEQRVACLNELRQQMLLNENVLNAPEQFSTMLKQKMDAYKSKTARQKYATNKTYEAFRLRSWNIHHVDENPPEFKYLIEIEPDDQDDDDDGEVEMATFKISFKCPISMRTLEEPVTSALCKHSYSKSAIEGYMQQMQDARTPMEKGLPVTCPVTGCNQALVPAILKRDLDLEKRVKRFLTKQANREKAKQRAQGESGRRAVVADDDDEAERDEMADD